MCLDFIDFSKFTSFSLSTVYPFLVVKHKGNNNSLERNSSIGIVSNLFLKFLQSNYATDQILDIDWEMKTRENSISLKIVKPDKLLKKRL